jgi:hypothetical protein
LDYNYELILLTFTEIIIIKSSSYEKYKNGVRIAVIALDLLHVKMKSCRAENRRFICNWTHWVMLLLRMQRKLGRN